MTIETAAAVLTCLSIGGGFMIYIGKSLRTLQHVNDSQVEMKSEMKDVKEDVADLKGRVSHVEGVCEGRGPFYAKHKV